MSLEVSPTVYAYGQALLRQAEAHLSDFSIELLAGRLTEPSGVLPRRLGVTITPKGEEKSGRFAFVGLVMPLDATDVNGPVDVHISTTVDPDYDKLKGLTIYDVGFWDVIRDGFLVKDVKEMKL
jgi:hypothetical protein